MAGAEPWCSDDVRLSVCEGFVGRPDGMGTFPQHGKARGSDRKVPISVPVPLVFVLVSLLVIPRPGCGGGDNT